MLYFPFSVSTREAAKSSYQVAHIENWSLVGDHHWVWEVEDDERMVAWLGGTPHAKTRTSRFAALAPT